MIDTSNNASGQIEPLPREERPGVGACDLLERAHAEIKTLRAQIAGLDELRSKARERDGLLDAARRAKAAFANYQRELDDERTARREAALADLLGDLIPLLDVMEALAGPAASEADPEAARHRIALLVGRLFEALEARGVRAIAPAGGLFDPAFHEAVGVIRTRDYPENTVVRLERKGYQLFGRVIRPALVRVALKPSEPSKESVRGAHDHDQ